MIDRLAPLVGRWTLRLDFARHGAGVVDGWAEHTSILGGSALLMRSGADLPEAPDTHSVVTVAADGDGFTQHYFDSRGVVRLYAMEFDGRVWTMARESPDFSDFAFRQRFTGTLSEDGSVIESRWEIAHGDDEYELDFEGRYERA